MIFSNWTNLDAKKNVNFQTELRKKIERMMTFAAGIYLNKKL